MKLVRFAAAMAMTLPVAAQASLRAVGTALLLAITAAVALGRIVVRPDRFQRHQIVAALVRAIIRPLPLVGALSALLGVIFALAIGYVFAIAQIEGLLLSALRQSLMRQAMPLLIGLLVLGEAGLGLAARLTAMTAGGEADTLRSLGIPPAEWVLPAALLEFLVLASVQFVAGTGIAHLAGALMLQMQLGVPTAHYADILVAPAARVEFWSGMARSETSGLLAWMVAATVGVSVAPGPDQIVRAVRTTFIVTLLGLLVLTALFNWLGA